MGRRDKRYRKDLHQQIYDQLTSMLAIGESKKAAMRDGTEKDKIFSRSTYVTYSKHCNYFADWIREKHPECTTLRSARKYVNEWLQSRTDQVDDSGRHLSAWTIQTESAAINKLYQIDKGDPGRFEPPKRNRSDIQRSRNVTARDAHFSESNNLELVHFCQGTGCRRNVLQRLEGRDLWSRGAMEALEADFKSRLDSLTSAERKDLAALQDGLRTFPEHQHFIHHRRDKGGRDRYAPVIGPYSDQIIKRMQATGEREKVWQHVSTNMDVHGYRAEYATKMYKTYARPIELIPYDSINRGTGRPYQHDVYTCRVDERGRKLDRRAMEICSKALGHNRACVVADNYLRGL